MSEATGMAAATRMSFLAPFTTHLFNPVTRLAAGILPGFGVLEHVGRTTGRTYRTPVLVRHGGDTYVIGLWYGTGVQWLRNVFVAGSCTMRTRGRYVRLVEPELFDDVDRRVLPLPLRLAGRLVGLTTFLRLHERRTGSGPRE